MNFSTRLKIWFKIIFCFLYSFRGSEAEFLSEKQTVEVLGAKSLIRFGDGEFDIFDKRDIHYQKWSPLLKEKFEMICNEYIRNGENCPFILCLPRKYFCCNSLQLLKKRVYVSCWSIPRYIFMTTFPQKNRIYGDAFLFAKGNEEIFSQIWMTTEKKIIFVHRDRIYADLFSQKYGKEISFIQCPERNAFEERQNIERKIEKQSNFEPNTTMILLSAGPAAKVIAFDLSQKGYQCIDTGHCWDYPLEKMY